LTTKVVGEKCMSAASGWQPFNRLITWAVWIRREAYRLVGYNQLWLQNMGNGQSLFAASGRRRIRADNARRVATSRPVQVSCLPPHLLLSYREHRE
jgi:hypothetical protein